jgi:hypothetical protein
MCFTSHRWMVRQVLMSIAFNNILFYLFFVIEIVSFDCFRSQDIWNNQDIVQTAEKKYSSLAGRQVPSLQDSPFLPSGKDYLVHGVITQNYIRTLLRAHSNLGKYNLRSAFITWLLRPKPQVSFAPIFHVGAHAVTQNQYTGNKFDNIHYFLSWHCALCKSVICRTSSWYNAKLHLYRVKFHRKGSMWYD